MTVKTFTARICSALVVAAALLPAAPAAGANRGQVSSPAGPGVAWRLTGGELRVVGAGFEARRRVVIWAGHRRRAFRTDRRGRFRVELAVPGPDTARVTSGRVRLRFRFGFPIRAAFYYPWFPEAWRQRGIYPFTQFTPGAGFYGDGPAQLRRQVRQMLYARFDAAIASWWGRETPSDLRLPALLGAARRTPLRWATYYEPEGQGDPDPAAIRADLEYIRDMRAIDPGYLRVNGRFVVFVWADGDDGAEMAARWRAANRGIGAYLVLKAFSGYRDVAGQPDAWHQYAPAEAVDHQRGNSFSVSPGFFHAAEPQPRLERSVARFADAVREMVASNEPWQLVTTFNEWGEGTAVEPADEWRSPSGYGDYLDVLRRNWR